MKTKALIQSAAVAMALHMASTQIQLWSGPERKRSAAPKIQSPSPKVQETTAGEPGKPQEPATTAQSPPQTEPQIIRETRLYEETLRDLAEKAEQIVQRMPDKPDELARNFGEL